MGLISSAEIADSDARHVLIRSLGPEMFISPDTTAVTLQPGDVLVLCTDGLHDEMSETAIAEIVSQKKNMDEIARELVTRAVEIDGGDNTTALVVRVRSVEQVGMYRRPPIPAVQMSCRRAAFTHALAVVLLPLERTETSRSSMRLVEW